MEYNLPNKPDKPPESTPAPAFAHSFDPPKPSPFRSGWGVLLLIFAAPVGLPIIIGLAAAAFGLLVGLTATLFAFFVSGIALVVAGGVGLLSVFAVVVSDVGFAVQLAGMSLVFLGVGLLLLKNVPLVLYAFPRVSAFFRRKVARKNNAAPCREFENFKKEAGFATESAQYTFTQPGNGEHQYIPPPEFAGHHLKTGKEIKKAQLNKLALLLLVLGGVLFGGGWLTGARGGALSWVDGRLVVESATSGYTTTTTAVFTEPLHSVALTAQAISLVVVSNDTVSQVELVSSGQNVAFTSRVDDGVLTVTQNRRNNVQFLDMRLVASVRREWRLYLPPAVYQSVSLRTNSGSIRVEGLAADHLNVRVSSGGVRLYDVDATDVEVNASSGGIRLNNVTYRTLNVDVASGGVNGTVRPVGAESAADIRTRSGGVNLIVDYPRARMNYTVRVSSGSLQLDGTRIQERNRTTNNNAPHSLNVRTNSGGLRLNFGNSSL